uniref:Nudix (nucleoside diphosphate linked moiety X)-type motif 12 n=1 Tax=Labrus bergylta TaxID=56723 RepID=A0A3Q3FC98_9LABR
MTSLQLSAKEEMVEKLLDAAARGDLTQVSSLLSHVPSLINQKGDSGWTALICDKFSVNSSSQTAYDISKFWGHKTVSNLLGRTDEGCQRVLPGCDLQQQENYFSREMLERLSVKRSEAAWLEAKQRDPDSVYLLFSNLNPMVCSSDQDQSEGGESRLCRFSIEAVEDLLQKPHTVLIFLGVEKRKGPSSPPEATREPPAWFAINTDEDAAELLKRSREKNCCFTKMAHRDLLKFSEEEAGVVAQARSVLAWHSRYSFCPTCGSSTNMEDGGYKRRCLNSDCRSLKGVHNTCYPRVGAVLLRGRRGRSGPAEGEEGGGGERRDPAEGEEGGGAVLLRGRRGRSGPAEGEEGGGGERRILLRGRRGEEGSC